MSCRLFWGPQHHQSFADLFSIQVDNDGIHAAMATNWGTDWSSSGAAVITTPGAVLLGIMGFGIVGLIRRRLA